MKKTTPAAIVLLLTTLLGLLLSCQKEVSQNSFPEPVMEKEISFRSYAEFQNLIRTDSALVLKVKTADLDLMDEHITEQEFCEKIKLVKLPAAEAGPAGSQTRTGSDVIVTLPTITVYGSWPGSGMQDWYFSPFITSYLHSPFDHLTPYQKMIMALQWQKWRDPLYKLPDTKKFLPDFTFDNQGGVLKIGFEKVNDNVIKAIIGLNPAKIMYPPGGNGFTDYIPATRGQVEFNLTKNGSGNFTGATFTSGTGSYTLNTGGTSINVKSSDLSLTISPQGKISNIKLSTGIGNYNIWAGSNLSNSVNVGLTNTINKTFTTTFQGGYDNGKLSGGFKGSYGSLSGHINLAPNFDAGIQLKIKF
jgi:hypothetical protein